MRRYLERLYHVFISCAFTFLGCFPKKNVYFFESFHGKQYSDNPRAIYEFLRNNYSDVICIWAVKKGFEAPFIDENVTFVRRLGLRWLLTMPRAKYWVFNTRMPKWMVKSKGTLYIQTWHGTPLKKIGLDIEEVRMPGNKTKLYQKEFMDESSRWDYLISPNTYSSNIFRKAFAYDGTIIEKGYPRNDILLKESSIALTSYIRQYLGITKEKKVLLYTPTWRDDEYFSRGKYKFINHFPFSDILGSDDDIVILVRLHYLVSDSIDISSFNRRVIDVSGYQDISHLYLIADVLITDYSSVMFDFAMTKKPMLFYMYDKEKYENETRGFYFNPEKVLPGEIITESHSLITCIQNALYGEYDMCLYEKFCDLFCIMESHSSQLIVEEVLGDKK